MENPAPQRQASGADTALSNAVTSVTVSQQESEGQASEPAGSNGGPHSPRAARSQVSTAVSFEGARAAGSAIQPERSVDEDSALSAAEPDGPVRSNRPQQGPRPANSLISTAVHPTLRHKHSTGGNHHLLPAPVQQAQQQLPPLPADAEVTAPQRTAHGRGAADRYASSPEVQRPHSITSQAAGTRAEAHGHGGRALEQGPGPGHGTRAHPARSSIRGATPASVQGQMQSPGPGAGSTALRKHHQQSLHWAADPGEGGGPGGGAAAAGVMDPAAAAAAAAALLGNGLVGGWGLVQGLGHCAAPPAANGQHAVLTHNHFFAAAAAAAAGGAGPLGSGAQGPLPLPGPPFSLAALGQLQLQAAAAMHQQAAAASALATADAAVVGAAPGHAHVVWRPPEHGGLGGSGAGPQILPALPGPPQNVEPPPAPDSQQAHQEQAQPGGSGRTAEDGTGGVGLGPCAGSHGRGGLRGGGASGRGFGDALFVKSTPFTLPSDSLNTWAAHCSHGAAAAAASPYALPPSLLGAAYGAGPEGGPHFALPGMHMRGLHGMLVGAAFGAAAGAAGGGTGGEALGTSPQARVRIKEEHQGLAAQPEQLQPPAQRPRQRRSAAHSTAGAPAIGLGQSLQGSEQSPGRDELPLHHHGGAAGVGGPSAGVDTEAAQAGAGPGTEAADSVQHAVGPATAAAPSAAGAGLARALHPPPVAPPPALQMFMPVMLPFGLVNAQAVLTHAEAAAAAAGPGPHELPQTAQLATAHTSTSAAAPIPARAQHAQVLHALLQPQQSGHESTHHGAAGHSGPLARGVGSRAAGAGAQHPPPTMAAASAARRSGDGAGVSAARQADRAQAPSAAGPPHGSERDRSNSAVNPAREAAAVSTAQHSAGSNPGARLGSPEAQAAALSAAETPTASVAAAPIGGAAAAAPQPDAPQQEMDHPAAGGAGEGADGAGAFGGLPFADAGNHNNHSNAYGAGPSMTHTADYRSHLQVALSLLLQATSAAYNSQRQSGINGVGEGSGIFGAAGPQASGSNALGHEVSDGGDAGGGGAAVAGGGGHGGGGGVDAVAQGGAVDSNGGGRTGGSGSGAGPGPLGGDAGATAAHAAGAAAAGHTAAQSMHGVAAGTAAAAHEPMETEGQVVEQARRTSGGVAGGGGSVAGAGGGPAGDGAPGAYQAPQWSTRRGGGGAAAASGDGGGARSAMHGSSGAAGGHAGRGGHAAPQSQGHLAAALPHHHHALQHGHAFHTHGSGAAGAASGHGGGAAGGAHRATSPGVGEVAGDPMQVDGGNGADAGGAVAGASVGSAGGAGAGDAAGEGEQADNNSALALDAEAGHPAASVHATVVADGSDASEDGDSGDDSASIEVPPAAARGHDGGVGGTGVAAAGGGVASSKAAEEIGSQRFGGARSHSREAQASKQQTGLLPQGPPIGPAPEAGMAGSHHAEARSPGRHNAAPEPRDSSMGMAAGPSHSGTGSGSNGSTTSDTVDMAEDDSRMGSASEHVGSGMAAADPRDVLMLTDENVVPLDEHGGENGGEAGGETGAAGVVGGVEDTGERGDENGNLGSAEGDDRGAEAEAEAGPRASVGPAAALLCMLGGGGGGGSTGHMDRARESEEKASPVDKVASHHPQNQAAVHNNHYPQHHGYGYATSHQHHPVVGDRGARASNSGTARSQHQHQHHQEQHGQHQAVASLYAAAADAAAAAVAAASGGAGAAAGGGLNNLHAVGATGVHGVGVPGARAAEALRDRGSPAPQAAQLQAANSTAVSPEALGYPLPALAGGSRSGAGGDGGAMMPMGPPHPGRGDRRDAAGAGPALSASNAEHQLAGVAAGGGAVGASRSVGAAAAGAAPATATLTESAAALLALAVGARQSSSQVAAGSARHRVGAQPLGQQPQAELQHGAAGDSYALGFGEGRQQGADPRLQNGDEAQGQGAAGPRTQSAARNSHLSRYRRNEAAAQAQPGPCHENTTLAAVGHAAVHPTSVLTTASQPAPHNLPHQHGHHVDEQQGQPQGHIPGSGSARADGAARLAAAAAAVPLEADAREAATHGSAEGGGRHPLAGNRASLDAVPQVTEIHGSFAGMAATAAEAVAQMLAAAPHGPIAQAAALPAQAQGSWREEDERVHSASPGGPSLSAVMPQYTEVHGAFMRRAGTAAEAQAGALRGSGGGGGADDGLAGGTNGPGTAACTARQTVGTAVGSEGGMQASMRGAAVAVASVGGTDDARARRVAGAATRGGTDVGNSGSGRGSAKAQSALHAAPLGEGAGRSGSIAGRSASRHGRARAGAGRGASEGSQHRVQSAAAEHLGGHAGAAYHRPPGGHGSNGVARTSPGTATAAMSGSCEAGTLPGALAAATDDGAAAAAAQVQHGSAAVAATLAGSRHDAMQQRVNATGPTGSEAGSAGAAAGTVLHGWRRARFTGQPGGPPLPQHGGDGRMAGGAGPSGLQAQQRHAAEAPLSTQANAYGGYDDDNDSDGERRRAEGPPRPQMTILVTSHTANSHHTVSGGTAVVSEADNGGTMGGSPRGAHGGGGGSPAAAAWEEEFDGPHRPRHGAGLDAPELQQQGSWRGADGAGGFGIGPAKSAVMSSGRVVEQAVSAHAAPNHVAVHPTASQQHQMEGRGGQGAAAAGDDGTGAAAGALAAVGSSDAAATGAHGVSRSNSRRGASGRARGTKRRRSKASLGISDGEEEGGGAALRSCGGGS